MNGIVIIADCCLPNRPSRFGLENALVAEVVRHERHEIGLRVLEAEPVEKPSEVRLRDRHIRRPERTADQEHRCRH